MDMPLIFEPATVNDRAFYIHVHHAASRAVVEEMFGWDEAVQDRMTGESFDRGDVYLVWHADERIGVVAWDVKDATLTVHDIYLLPEHQGHGYGSRILQDFMNNPSGGYDRIDLQTLKLNMRARALYERLGFEVYDATETHWKIRRIIG
ncbi:MAG: N-acetyltransferase [Alphaproteobacteria bacterium]|nr:MAG: N-acetyltransferase [Alphaproteobacteria bacterium]